VPRRSLNLTSWEAAENLVREMNVRGTAVIETPPPPPEPLRKVEMTEAVKLFLEEAVSRKLAEESMRLYRRFVGRQLPAWFADCGWLHVEDITFERLVKFKTSWTFSAVTAAKRLELLKAFVGFWVAADWLEKNYAERFKAPETDEPPTLPYTDEEMARIVAACETAEEPISRWTTFELRNPPRLWLHGAFDDVHSRLVDAAGSVEIADMGGEVYLQRTPLIAGVKGGSGSVEAEASLDERPRLAAETGICARRDRYRRFEPLGRTASVFVYHDGGAREYSKVRRACLSNDARNCRHGNRYEETAG